MRRFQAIPILALLTAAAAAAPLTGTSGDPSNRDDAGAAVASRAPLDRSLLWRSEEALGRVLPGEFLQARRGGAYYGYDVDHIDLSIDIPPGLFWISAEATLTATIADSALAEIAVDLADALVVDSVTVDGTPAPFVHADDRVLVTPAVPPDPGSQIAVRIGYHGSPQPVHHKGFQFGSRGFARVVYTVSTPYSTPGQTVVPISSTWRPCKDVPDDKSTLTMVITVPDTELACSNGVMTSNVDNGDGTRTVTWEHGFPVAPHYVALASSDYVTIDDLYVGAGGSAAVQHFVYPELYDDALESFDIVVPAMEQFAAVFGEYPFLGEKYGMFTAPSLVAVESQTIVAYMDVLVDGGHAYDWLVVHELAHMWWGDCVSAESWDHVWLNEGFASYAEALWQEALGGPEAYRWYMQNLDSGPWSGTVFDPPSIWDSIVYDRGAWVLHMLRGILGNASFFQFLLDYRAAHEHATATTDDLVAVAESLYGSDLGWFFDQWVYREGRPEYEYDWTASGTGPYTVHLGLRQVQSGTYPTYRMPVRVRVETVTGNEAHVVWDSLRTQTFDLVVDDEPTGVVMDPKNWILGDFLEIPTGFAGPLPSPGQLPSCEPNPFASSTRIRFELARPSDVALRVFDVRGRHVRTIMHSRLGAGLHALTWDGRNELGEPVPNGVYFYRLTGPDGVLRGRMTRLH